MDLSLSAERSVWARVNGKRSRGGSVENKADQEVEQIGGLEKIQEKRTTPEDKTFLPWSRTNPPTLLQLTNHPAIATKQGPEAHRGRHRSPAVFAWVLRPATARPRAGGGGAAYPGPDLL